MSSSMFSKRKSTQKPHEGLIQDFQKTFPQISSQRKGGFPHLAHDGVDPRTLARVDSNQEIIGIKHTSPRSQQQQFLVTPSLFKTDSFGLQPLFGQTQGSTTPSAGQMCTVLHGSAGDLHTPIMERSWMTSFLNPPSHTQQQQPVYDPRIEQPAYQMPGYYEQLASWDPLNDRAFHAPSNDTNPSTNTSNDVTFTDKRTGFDSAVPVVQPPDGLPNFSVFRYLTTLHARTATANVKDDTPITYLNKGQSYSISVVDSAPPPRSAYPVQYRTHIRVTFDEASQRSRRNACWKLWMDTRGSQQARTQKRSALAVEYVDLREEKEESQRSDIQLKNTTFDGFSVTWTGNSGTGRFNTTIGVKFNFLSTDFTLSKGVKGPPVRICAKTEIVSPSADAAEICYLKAKVFRDHGAERRLSHDTDHLQKEMIKIKQQIAKTESGPNEVGGRKLASHSEALEHIDLHSMKSAKARRTLPSDLQSNSLRKSSAAKDDLHTKLFSMQNLLSSSQPVSVFGLKGDEYDDPDQHPVCLQLDAEKNQQNNKMQSKTLTAQDSFLPTPAESTSEQNSESPDNQKAQSADTLSNGINSVNMPWRISPKVNGHRADADAMDIVPSRPASPAIACLYVHFPEFDKANTYYRAIYLTERSAHNLRRQISRKFQIDPEQILRLTHVTPEGMHIFIDDDVVRELPEGQDMVARISDVSEQGRPANLPSAFGIELVY